MHVQARPGIAEIADECSRGGVREWVSNSLCFPSGARLISKLPSAIGCGVHAVALGRHLQWRQHAKAKGAGMERFGLRLSRDSDSDSD